MSVYNFYRDRKWARTTVIIQRRGKGPGNTRGSSPLHTKGEAAHYTQVCTHIHVRTQHITYMYTLTHMDTYRQHTVYKPQTLQQVAAIYNE